MISSEVFFAFALHCSSFCTFFLRLPQCLRRWQPKINFSMFCILVRGNHEDQRNFLQSSSPLTNLSTWKLYFQGSFPFLLYFCRIWLPYQKLFFLSLLSIWSSKIIFSPLSCSYLSEPPSFFRTKIPFVISSCFYFMISLILNKPTISSFAAMRTFLAFSKIKDYPKYVCFPLLPVPKSCFFLFVLFRLWIWSDFLSLLCFCWGHHSNPPNRVRICACCELSRCFLETDIRY